MNLYDLLKNKEPEKHKVFISYYHTEDEFYRKQFETKFGHLFINKSVSPGDIDSDLADDYIKHLIQEEYLTDTSVLIVLVGAKTYGRKHVDWEISAALNKKVGGYSGLLGLCLPTHPAFGRETYSSAIVPARLVDNLKSKYAGFFDWTTDENRMKQLIEEAFKNRIEKADKIDNSRKQLERNLNE